MNSHTNPVTYPLNPGDIEALLHIPFEEKVVEGPHQPSLYNIDPNTVITVSSKGALHVYTQRSGILGVFDAIFLFFIQLIETTNPQVIADKFYSLINNTEVKVAVLRASSPELSSIQALMNKITNNGQDASDRISYLREVITDLEEGNTIFHADVDTLVGFLETHPDCILLDKIKDVGGLNHIHPNVIHALARHINHIQSVSVTEFISHERMDPYPEEAQAFMATYKLENIDLSDEKAKDLIRDLTDKLDSALDAFKFKQSYLQLYDELNKPGLPPVLLNPYRGKYSDVQLRNMEQIGALIPALEKTTDDRTKLKDRVLPKWNDPLLFIGLLKAAGITLERFSSPEIGPDLEKVIKSAEIKGKVADEIQYRKFARKFCKAHWEGMLSITINLLERKESYAISSNPVEYDLLQKQLSNCGEILKALSEAGVDLNNVDLINFIINDIAPGFHIENPNFESEVLPRLLDKAIISQLKVKWELQYMVIELAKAHPDVCIMQDILIYIAKDKRANPVLEQNLTFIGNIILQMRGQGYTIDEILDVLNTGFSDDDILKPMESLSVELPKEAVFDVYRKEKTLAQFAKQYPDSPLGKFIIASSNHRSSIINANLQALYTRLTQLQEMGFGPQAKYSYSSEVYAFLGSYGLEELDLSAMDFSETLFHPPILTMALFDFMKMKAPKTYAIGIKLMQEDITSHTKHLIGISFIKYGRIYHPDAGAAQLPYEPGSSMEYLTAKTFAEEIIPYIEGESHRSIDEDFMPIEKKPSSVNHMFLPSPSEKINHEDESSPDVISRQPSLLEAGRNAIYELFSGSGASVEITPPVVERTQVLPPKGIASTPVTSSHNKMGALHTFITRIASRSQTDPVVTAVAEKPAPVVKPAAAPAAPQIDLDDCRYFAIDDDDMSPTTPLAATRDLAITSMTMGTFVSSAVSTAPVEEKKQPLAGRASSALTGAMSKVASGAASIAQGFRGIKAPNLFKKG